MGWLDWLRDAWGPVPVAEAAIGPTTDPDAGLTAAQGGSSAFRRLTQSERDLDRVTYDRAREIVWWLYEMNPIAKRLVELTRDWVLGEGVEIRVESESTPGPDRRTRDQLDAGDDEGDQTGAEAERVREAISQRARGRQRQRQAVVDAFWHDGRNKMNRRLYDRVMELGLWGEQCYPVAVNPLNGAVSLSTADVAQISEVIVDPTNIEETIAVEFKALAGQEPRRFRVVHAETDVQSRAFGRLIGARTDETGQIVETYRLPGETTERVYAGSCFFFPVNKVAAATRGRSDLQCLADWIDGLDQVQMNEVDRSLLIKSFVWDVSLVDANPTQVVDRANELAAPEQVPKPGAVRVHNDKEVWTAVAPNMNSWDAVNAFDMLQNYISAGAGIPKTWLSGTVDVNKATAQELGEPAFKRLTARQSYVREMLREIVTFVLDQAELAGRIARRASPAGRPPAEWPIQVVMPEIRSRDLRGTADTINIAGQGLVKLHAAGLIDAETAQDVVKVLIDEVGVEVDLDAMRARIRLERQERDQAAQQAAQQQAATRAAQTANGRAPATNGAAGGAAGTVRVA